MTAVYQVGLFWRCYSILLGAAFMWTGIWFLANPARGWSVVFGIGLVGAAAWLVGAVWSERLEWSSDGVRWRTFWVWRSMPYADMRRVRVTWGGPRRPMFLGRRGMIQGQSSTLTIHYGMYRRRWRREWDAILNKHAPHVEGRFASGRWYHEGERLPRSPV